MIDQITVLENIKNTGHGENDGPIPPFPHMEKCRHSLLTLF